MTVKLSLCIPTYNRGGFIGETLESIVSQATDDIEIIVSDNASQDDTESIVRSFQTRFPRITYHRWERNMGADKNFLKVVELAKGEYCWFMGSDDKVENGGIATVLSQLSKHPDLAGVSVDRYEYTPDLRGRIVSRPVSGGALPEDIVFTNAEQAFVMLGDYLGYIPGQIVHRELWNKTVASNPVENYYNAYVHVFVIAKMLQTHPRWLYVKQPCVGWRSGNDSFLSEGILKRLAIDVIGYEKITGDVFGRPSKPYQEMLKIVSTVHVRYAVMGAKLNGAPADFFIKALKMCVPVYWTIPTFWIKTFPWFITPRFIALGLRAIYRRTVKARKVAELELKVRGGTRD